MFYLRKKKKTRTTKSSQVIGTAKCGREKTGVMGTPPLLIIIIFYKIEREENDGPHLQ